MQKIIIIKFVPFCLINTAKKYTSNQICSVLFDKHYKRLRLLQKNFLRHRHELLSCFTKDGEMYLYRTGKVDISVLNSYHPAIHTEKEVAAAL